MTETEVLTKDVGSILVGKETVDKKLINEVGGLKEAMNKLKSIIDDKKIIMVSGAKGLSPREFVHKWA